MLNIVEDKALRFFAAFDTLAQRLEDLEFLGVSTAEVRKAMQGFEQLREELALVDSQIASLRPGAGYREGPG